MRRLEVAVCVLVGLGSAGCDQLGNPKQYATPPTTWRDANGHLVTTTRSYTNQTTIRRLVSDRMEGLDYAASSIGPSQTLTIVDVVAHSFRVSRGGAVTLITRFALPDGRTVERRWKAPSERRKWSAAFALAAPPKEAVTAAVP